jgi:hypothetical protein
MKSGSLPTLRAAKGATLGSVAIFSVTTIHHVYGAYIYSTPWRVHAAIVSGIATALIAASAWLLQRHWNDGFGLAASRVFIPVTFMVPFLGFGVFEGIYNHSLKVVLYFAHVSPTLMARLFPPPTYEMPNNAFFEITGVLQVIPGLMTGYYLYQFVRGLQNSRDAGSDTHVSAT